MPDHPPRDAKGPLSPVEMVALFACGFVLIFAPTDGWPPIRDYFELGRAMTPLNMALVILRVACLVYGWFLIVRVARSAWKNRPQPAVGVPRRKRRRRP